MKTFLKEIRKKHDLTQSKLADLLNVKRGTIAQIEQGNNKMTAELAKKIQEVFGYSIDYVLNFNETSELNKITDFKEELSTELDHDMDLSYNFDKLQMLKMVKQEFCNDKKLKNISHRYERFNSIHKIDDIIEEYQSGKLIIDNLSIKQKHEFFTLIDLGFKYLIEDLFYTMQFEYDVIKKFYKAE